MRDSLVFYVNGKEHRVSGDSAFMPLSTYLRYEQGATGTKVVCEEGDCGACSVLLGRLHDGEISYRVVNSCIQFLYQLDCSHIITIEGLKYSGQLNPVQEAMVACHGTQCGYCTPGFVVAMCGMLAGKKCLDEQEIKDGLTGNLCRCTGYEPIIKAGLAVDGDKLLTLHELYPSAEMKAAFRKNAGQAVLIETANRKFFNPIDVASAVKFKADNAGTVIVAGGTDVCVFWNKRSIEPSSLMSVSLLPGLRGIELKQGKLIVGAKTTLTDLENFTQEHLPELHKILWLFGSPQIRNAGTLAGNIANGSPIGDSLPFLHVAEAELELTGTKGTRLVNINKFYLGYKKFDLAADEMITRIFIPLPQSGEILRLYKVSKRKHLDISAFAAAFKLKLSGNKIESIFIAFGGVAATVLRMHKAEMFLIGKTFDLTTLQEAAKIAVGEISPLSDVRGSSQFRKLLAENAFSKLFYDVKQPEVVA
jgi:xanthine dehydrogenase small subunit